MKKIRNVLPIAMLVWVIACSGDKVNKFEYFFGIIKNVGSSTKGTCNVTFGMPHGELKKIETLECYSNSELDSTVLYHDLRQLKGYDFNIDSLTIPSVYGKLINQCSIMKVYAPSAGEYNEIRFNRYLLFDNEGVVALVKEEWENDPSDFGKFMLSANPTQIDISKLERQPSVTEIKETSADKNNSDGLKPSKTINEIKLALLYERINKAELLLGRPDKIGDLGHWSKCYAVYLNRVIDIDGVKKNLVLFIRKKDASTKYTSSFPQFIEEIYAVRHGEKACFGVHCITL